MRRENVKLFNKELTLSSFTTLVD